MSEQDATDEQSAADETVADSEPDPSDAETETASETPETDATDAVEDSATASEDGGVDFKDDLDVADEVVEYVESTGTEELADEIATLRFEVDTLESDIEEYEQQVETLQSKLKRKQADFENYKKRMKRRQEEQKARATEDLVERLLDVRDNLQRAVEQDENADIRDGVQSTLRQFDRVFDEENVTAIEPEPGDDVDPQRHEVLVRMDSDQPAGTIAQVHRPGYEMAEKIIRPAQVAVSEGDG